MDKYKNGAKVEMKCPMFGEEIIKGFVAKQIDEYHFLVRLEFAFTYTNPGKKWIKVYRPFAHQAVKLI